MREVSLSAAQIQSALPRVSVGLAKYEWLQGELPLRDVSSDQEYQKRFGGFYRVRRHSTWRVAFFEILERSKPAPISFGHALRALHAATGRVEASFASKLVATLDPAQPVIDSVVFTNLGLKLPTASAANRFSNTRPASAAWRALFGLSGVHAWPRLGRAISTHVSRRADNRDQDARSCALAKSRDGLTSACS